jgi:exosortase
VVTAFLKRGSADVVSALFTITGTTHHREAYVFMLPRLSIEVADECSGIRSSMALGITALIVAHLMLGRVWNKALLLLAVLPIAVIKNGVRIASLSWLASDVDPAFMKGRLHTDGGVVFFLLALALLFPVLAALRRLDAEPTASAAGAPVRGWPARWRRGPA